jgi:phosphatidylinositol-3-phosphatase
MSFAYSGNIKVSTASSTSPQHVILIMMENKGDANIVGSSSAKYENYLIKNYAFAKDYFALSTSGLHDYIGITDGSTAITNFSPECAPSSCYTTNTNIFSLLQSHGLTWKGYAESMPSNCYTSAYGKLPNEYWPWHTAIPYYTDLSSYCSHNDVPLGNVTLQTGNFFNDLKSNNLPNFSMVSPNVCDDMHTCPTGENAIAMGDKWLHAFVGDIISSSSFSSTVILITFDNGPSLSKPIPMIIVGPSTLVNHGQFTQMFSHYSTLATIEDIFNLGNLGRGDATATPMSAIIPSA